MEKMNNHRQSSIDELINNYLKVFEKLPDKPIMVPWGLLQDLLEEAIISKVPVSQEDIEKRIEENGEPVDIVRP